MAIRVDVVDVGLLQRDDAVGQHVTGAAAYDRQLQAALGIFARDHVIGAVGIEQRQPVVETSVIDCAGVARVELLNLAV